MLLCFSDGTDETLIGSGEQIMINIIAVWAVKLLIALVKMQIFVLSNAQLQAIPHPIIHDNKVAERRDDNFQESLQLRK